jgi:hypothetical protein
MPRRTFHLLFALALLSAFTAGCGSHRPALMPAQAVVTLDGEPVAGAAVMLVPTAGGRAVSGVTNDSGRAVLSTYGSRDGIPAGTYKAVVSKRVLKENAAKLAADGMALFAESDFDNLLPARYASHASTDLTVTVEGRTREIVIALRSEPAGK